MTHSAEKDAPRVNPSWTYRALYLLIATGTVLAVVALSGSILSGAVAGGGCALCATCAALATKWDHGIFPPGDSNVPSAEVELLNEWYDWWIETPGAPEKMPNALHVRTALLLTRPHRDAKEKT